MGKQGACAPTSVKRETEDGLPEALVLGDAGTDNPFATEQGTEERSRVVLGVSER